MKRQYILDSNVIVKWFLPEQDSDKALLLRDMFMDGRCALMILELTLIEFANVLRKRREAIAEEAAVEMIKELMGLNLGRNS